MMPDARATKGPLCYPIWIDSGILGHYGREIGATDPASALLALARAIVNGPSWREMPLGVLLVRPAPRPALAIIGSFDARDEARLRGQAASLQQRCAHLRYIDYARAEEDCAELAAQLVARFGRQEISRFCFTALPRGGLIVLGMLAHLLQLGQEQLHPPYPQEAPLVIVDDCALTGARFGRFLGSCAGQQVIFAPLYAHPDLRTAITAHEARVVDCLSARDLYDYGPEQLGPEYPAWQSRWRERCRDLRYWFGMCDHVCFAWNEPDHSIWDPAAARVVPSWRIVPPELCLKNRRSDDSQVIPVQVQLPGQGPLRPSEDVLFGEFAGQIVMVNLRSGETFGLADAAAAMWRAIIEYGNFKEVLAALQRDYDVDLDRLRADLATFIDDLLARGLLEQSDDPGC